MVFASSLIDSVQDDRSRDVAKRVQGETKELIAVVDDILDYARLEADSLGLIAEEVDLAKIVERSVDAVRASRGGALGSLRREPSRRPAQGERRRLARPAGRHEPPRRRRCARQTRGAIKVRVRADRDTVAVEVTDGGPGLSESQVMAIWDPFHVRRRRAVKSGSGLAMAIDARASSERMGGSVEAISKRGKGTTFRVRLPRAQVTV